MAEGKIEITFLPVTVLGDVTMVPEPRVVELVYTRDDGVVWRDDWGQGFTAWADIDEVTPYE